MPDITYLTSDLFTDSGASQENRIAGFLDFETRFAAATDLPTKGPLAELVQTERDRDAALAVLVRQAQSAAGTAQADQQQDHLITAAQRTVALDFTARLDGFITALVPKPDQKSLRAAFFPQGRTSLGDAKVDALPKLLADVETQLTKNKAAFGDMGDMLLTQAAAAFKPYTEARADEVKQQNATGLNQHGVADLLPLLSSALTDGLHLLCLALRPHPERAATFFIPRYFQRQRVSNPAGVRRRRLAAQENRGLFDLTTKTGKAATTITLQVAAGEGGPLLLGRSADAGTAPDPATAKPIKPGEEATFALADLGAGPWLVARNAGVRVLNVVATLG